MPWSHNSRDPIYGTNFLTDKGKNKKEETLENTVCCLK